MSYNRDVEPHFSSHWSIDSHASANSFVAHSEKLTFHFGFGSIQLQKEQTRTNSIVRQK